MFAVATADESGRIVHRFFAAPALAGLSFLAQAVDVSGCGVSNVLLHTP
ncbi:MAG: hypothetical protein JNK15_18165 [Planctomycetes bacterium]|nr:hypothetical protein [Planctomycetota bacterium]